MDPHYSKALPSKIEYERHYPMRCYLKSCFQMLRHKRLNEVIATDTNFASDKSIEGYNCAQFFFGMTSIALLVT
jgi:hypothetical protein